MTPQELALRLVIIRVLKDLLSETDDADREIVASTWIPGDRLSGAIAGRPAGWVQLKKPSTSAAVTDRSKFEAWVREHHAGEWETYVATPVARVRPAYERALLNLAKERGVAASADGEEIPGITVTVGSPTPAVTLADDAVQLVREAWESGELWGIVGSLLPQLEAASGGEA